VLFEVMQNKERVRNLLVSKS